MAPATKALPREAPPLRNLQRQPGFALVAIVSLAVGIGTNTAIFSVLDALLLRQPAIGGVDPATCAAVTAMLFAVALVACYRPVANVARGDRSIYLLISRCD